MPVDIQTRHSVANDFPAIYDLARRKLHYRHTLTKAAILARLIFMSSGTLEPQPKFQTVCGARTRRGRPCSRPAGMGTSHSGSGNCYLHGGGPLVSKPGGRYSTLEDREFRARFDEFEQEPNPLDLLPDLALLRAFLADVIDNWEDVFGPDGALARWQESLDAGKKQPKIGRIPDFASISNLVVKIGEMVNNIQRQRARTAIPLDRHHQLMELVAEGLEQALNINKIEEEISHEIRSTTNNRWKYLTGLFDRAGAAAIERKQLPEPEEPTDDGLPQ